MKKISVCIACYNEEENIYPMYAAATKQMEKFTDRYDYEILFADNDSKDGTRDILRSIAKNDKHVKVIFNTRNFGPMRSGTNCERRATGDVIVELPCDFQVPPELIEEYLKLWEEGNLIVCGQKFESEENKFKFFLRKVYYKIIKIFSDTPQYDQLCGLMVIDRKIVDVMRQVDEPEMSFRHLIAELGYKIKLVPYKQQKRKAGKSSYNIYRYFDFAITSLINTSYLPLRLSVILGLGISIICFIIGVVYLIYKLIHWDTFNAGIAPVLIGIFFLGAVQLFFLGILGEYIGMILKKTRKYPIVVEEEVINFDNEIMKEEEREQ